jgi:hypothetical protein
MEKFDQADFENILAICKANTGNIYRPPVIGPLMEEFVKQAEIYKKTKVNSEIISELIRILKTDHPFFFDKDER